MSEIKALSLKGIRAFHPDPSDIEKQTIEFDGPVTLITGANGAGKTTIIEALSYATTGKTKKKAITAEFLHDPRMWGSKSLNSEVKLTIKDINGEDKTITRLAKLDVGKTGAGITLKTLGSNISDNNGKNDHTISEINEEVPKLMGVSQAILENVIFCHQDDACWPIECNSKQLKERFDTIFGADQYDNAIKEIKENAKKWRESLAAKEKREAHLSANQEHRDDTEQRMKSLREEVNRLSKEMKEREIRENQLKERVNNVKASSRVIDECKNTITLCRERINTKEKEISQIESITGKDHPSLEECHDRLDSLQSEHTSVKERLDYYQAEIFRIEDETTSINNTLPSKNRELNKKREMMNDGDRQRQIYDSTLREFKDQFNTDNYEEMKQNLSIMLKSQEQSVNRQKKEIDTEELSYENNRRTHENDLKEYEKEINNREGSMRMIEQDLNRESEYDESSLGSIDQELISLNEKLAAESQDIESEKKLRMRQQEINVRRKQIGNELEEIRSKIGQCNEQVELEQQITNATITMNHCQGEIDRIVQQIKEGLGDSDVDQYTAGRKVKLAMDNTREERMRAIRNKDIANKEYTACESYIEMKLQDKADIEKKIEADTQKIESVIGSKDFDELYMEKKKELEDVNTEITRLSNSESIYKNFRVEAQKPDCCCPLCRRQFHDYQERDIFIRDFIDRVIQDLPMMLHNARERKAKFEYELEQLEKIRPCVERKIRLITQLERVIEELTEKQNKGAELKQRLEEFAKELEMAEEMYDRVSRLESTGNQLGGALRDYSNAELSLNKLAAKRTPGLPSKEELEEQKLKLENERDDLIVESDKITQKIDEARSRIDELRRKINELVAKRDHVQTILERRSELRIKMEKMKTEVVGFRQSIEQMHSVIESLKQQHDEAKTELQQKLEGAQLYMETIRQQYNDCASYVRRLNEAQSKITEIDAGTLPQEIEALDNEIREMNEKLREQNESIKKFREMRESSQKQLKEAFQDINLIQHHIMYHKAKQERDKEEAALEKSEQELRALNITQDDLDIDRLQNEYKDASVATARAKTAYETNQKNLRTIMDDYDKYESVPVELTKIRIDIKASQLALEDLNKFRVKLEETLLEYHTRKLKEINDTIADLWSDTYYGHDLESIMIKTEGKGGRSAYKYMVVMKKDGVEVEMSNRCSAGQKMLASLIIRLALAQAFSANCGIIALDEPTTNLDVENMGNFASRLSELVRKRSRKSNFQMIIITHSQDFVNLLARDMEIDHFYQITKESDGEHHFSQIARKRADYLTLGQ